MTLIRLGRGFEADNEFQMGATMEFSGEGTYDVARALERVQGAERLKIETTRRNARLAAMRRPPRVRQIPESMPSSPETADMGQPSPVAPATAEQPVPPVEADPNDPFAADIMGPIGADTVEPAAPPTEETDVADTATQGAMDDPFGAEEPLSEPPAGATDAASADPFATAPQTPPAAAQGNAADRGKALQSFFRAVTGAIPGIGGSKTDDASSSEPPDPFGAPAEQAAPAADATDPFGGATNEPATDPFGAADDSAADPFGAPAPAGQPAAPPPADAGAAPAADTDPFGAPAGDVFGGPAADTPEAAPPPPPPPAPPAAAADDPFADLGGPDADPFGNAPASDAPEPADATGGDSADEQVDPFADDT
jgi:hypothetical protein